MDTTINMSRESVMWRIIIDAIKMSYTCSVSLASPDFLLFLSLKPYFKLKHHISSRGEGDVSINLPVLHEKADILNMLMPKQ